MVESEGAEETTQGGIIDTEEVIQNLWTELLRSEVPPCWDGVAGHVQGMLIRAIAEATDKAAVQST